MAKIDKDSDGEKLINVGNVVGVNGVNTPDDVLVTQALLKYFGRTSIKWTKQTLPEPSGALDKATQKAIFDYQEFVRAIWKNPYWVAKDGRIASYKSDVKLLYKQEWTIVSLNNHCGMLSAGFQEGNHVDAICKRWRYTVGVVLGQYNPLFL